MPVIPVVLGAFLRQIVMAIASGAVVTGAQEALDGTFKTLVTELKDSEGLTEQEAKDVIGNILIDLAINSASIFAVLKTGAGVKVAEYLGLTSRNFSKAALTPKAGKVAETLAATGGKDLVKRGLPSLLKVAAFPATLIWLGSAIGNIIEVGAYKCAQINAIYKQIGIPFQYNCLPSERNPGPFTSSSSVTFSDFANSLESAGVKGIQDPFKYQSILYSREALADLVDALYGKEVLAGRNPSVKDFIPLISPYLVMPSSGGALPSPVTSVTTIPSIPKVYTGIVSQGIIGKGLSFTPRPDDLIESIDELKQAAANNLTPFLETLLGKVVYEIKIVPSIVTKDGFKQTGQVQQIKTGTTTSGAPKYKTVYNKFAVLNLYVLTDKGVRSKISSIVLGPTNSAKLTVGINDLQVVQNELPKLVTTTDINDIKGIETANAVTVSTPTASGGTSVPALDTAPVVTPASPASAPASGTAVPGNNALTLFEWYLAQGQTLPSVAIRSKLYEELGLGLQSFYTGTAEQNSKLLVALKAQAAQKAIVQPEPAATSKASTATKSPATAKPAGSDQSKERKVIRIYTTTSGERVTKYSDGTETRVKIKK